MRDTTVGRRPLLAGSFVEPIEEERLLAGEAARGGPSVDIGAAATGICANAWSPLLVTRLGRPSGLASEAVLAAGSASCACISRTEGLRRRAWPCSALAESADVTRLSEVVAGRPAERGGSGVLERTIFVTTMVVCAGTAGGGEDDTMSPRLSERGSGGAMPFPFLLACTVTLPSTDMVSEEAVVVREFVDRWLLMLGLAVVDEDDEPGGGDAVAVFAAAAAAAARASPRPLSALVADAPLCISARATPSASLTLLLRGVLVACCTDPISGSSSVQNELLDV